MSEVLSTTRINLNSRTGRDAARLENAENVRAEVEEERHAADEQTARLKAMRLARDRLGS